MFIFLAFGRGTYPEQLTFYHIFLIQLSTKGFAQESSSVTVMDLRFKLINFQSEVQHLDH